jgi:hypothetical protein
MDDSQEPNQAAANAPAPQPPPPTPAPPAANSSRPPLAGANAPLKQIRTFQGDVAEALARQNESLYSIQAKEHLKNGTPASGGGSRSALPLLAGSLLLLALAAFGAYFAYGEFERKTAPPVVAVPESRLLPAESTVEIDVANLGRDALFAAIAQATAGAKPGELRHLDLRQGTSTETAEQFFAALDTQAPGPLVRALDPVFMLGAIGLPDQSLGSSRFLIFKLSSFPNAFGGMLAWEKAMPSDVEPLFADPSLLQAVGPTSVFQDVVYKNKDLRALYTDASSSVSTSSPQATPVLLYSFLNNTMLIITDRPETLQTLIDRLTQESLAR